MIEHSKDNFIEPYERMDFEKMNDINFKVRHRYDWKAAARER